MAGAEQKGEERWERMLTAVERLTGKMEAMEVGQRKAEEDRALMARQLQETEQTVSRLRLELLAKDLEGNESNSEREHRVHRGDERGGGFGREGGRERREQWGEGSSGPVLYRSGRFLSSTGMIQESGLIGVWNISQFIRCPNGSGQALPRRIWRETRRSGCRCIN